MCVLLPSGETRNYINIQKERSRLWDRSEWTDECQEAFDKLKELCTSTPILVYANYKKPFQLQTDASDFGLGAVLYSEMLMIVKGLLLLLVIA